MFESYGAYVCAHAALGCLARCLWEVCKQDRATQVQLFLLPAYAAKMLIDPHLCYALMLLLLCHVLHSGGALPVSFWPGSIQRLPGKKEVYPVTFCSSF